MIRNCVVNASLCNIDVFFFPVIVQDWYFFHNIVLSRNSFKFIFPLCSTCSDVFQLVAYPPPPLPPKENRDSKLWRHCVSMSVSMRLVVSFLFHFSLCCVICLLRNTYVFSSILLYIIIIRIIIIQLELLQLIIFRRLNY